MEQLFPTTELADAASVAPAYQDIVKCYQWLYNVCGIHHSDISINNLMYRREGGRIHGVLNDFDLVQCGDFTAPQSRQRTGTKQFVAYDLLDPHKSHPHFYRHDLESIFYVMIFHLCGHHQAAEIPFSLQDWPEISSEALWHRKVSFFMLTLPPPTDHFAPLSTQLNKLWAIFHRGFSARTMHETFAGTGEDKPFKEETLDDHVTFDAFNEILTSADNKI